MKNLIQFSLSLLLIIPFTLNAQFDKWTNYWYISSVNTALEHDGKLWLATDGGLVSIDQNTNETFQYTKANSGLPSNDIEVLTVDPANNLWIGTYASGIAKMEGNTFTHFPIPETLYNPNYQKLLYCMTFDTEGKALIGTTQGLITYDDGDWSIMHTDSVNNSFFSGVWDIDFDQNGDLLLASHQLFKMDANGITNLMDTSDIFSYGSSNLMVLDNGDLLFHGDLGEVVVLHENGMTQYSNFNPNSNPIPNLFNVFGFEKDPNGDVWFNLPFSQTQYRYSDGVFFEEAILDPSEASLSTFLFWDSNGILWSNAKYEALKITPNTTVRYDLMDIERAAQFMGEIVKDHENTPHFINYNQVYKTDQNQYTNNNYAFNGGPFDVKSITFDQNNLPWFSTGSSVLRPSIGGLQEVNHSNSILPIANLGQTATDSNNNFWVAAHANGLYKFDGIDWEHHSSFPFGVNASITKIIPDNSGSLWLKSYWNSTNYLSKYDGQNTEIFTPSNSGLLSEYFQGMNVDENNNLWLTHGDKIQKYDGTDWTTYDLSSFPDPPTYTYSIDFWEDLLIITSYRGLYIYDVVNETLEIYHEYNSGISPGYPVRAKLADDGFIWMTNGTELDVFDAGFTNNIPTGIDPVNNTISSMSVFPNPVQSHCNIKLQLREPMPQANIQVFDGLGREISREVAGDLPTGIQELSINLNNIPPGIYHLKVGNEQHSFSKKIVKK